MEKDGQEEGAKQQQPEEDDVAGVLSSQCRAVLSAIAVRLDIHSLLASDNPPAAVNALSVVSDPTAILPDTASVATAGPPARSVSSRNDVSKITVAINITLLRRNFDTVDGLLPSLFEHGLTEDHPFHKLYVMLALAARLMMGADGGWESSNASASFSESTGEGKERKEIAAGGEWQSSTSSPAEFFLATHSSSLLALTPLDLLKCADLALCPAAEGGSEAVARGVLRLAVQLLVREPRPSYALLGNLYRRLVELSPDKKDVSYL
jgi:hypothetical protein